MLHVATCLLFDKDGKLLIYLRDDKPTIAFPNHWDLFGGFIEDGETVEQALVREIEEELGITISNYTYWTDYECLSGDSKPNIKHVYIAHTDRSPDNLELLDCGQRLTSISLDERQNYKFGSILGRIVDDYAQSQKAVA